MKIEAKSLSQIRDPNCSKCALHKSTQTVCVMGKGPVPADFALIGEAPGEAESKTGKPFMGPAGQLLDKILNELNIIDRCFITNVCRCRPPSNRKPTESEVDKCTSSYLIDELIQVNPLGIVLLGRTATDYFFKDGFIRGQVYKTSGSFMVPTWHPAYCLPGRSPGATPQLKEHIAKLVAVIENTASPSRLQDGVDSLLDGFVGRRNER